MTHTPLCNVGHPATICKATARRNRLRPLTAVLAVLTLAACATPPELDTLEAGFEAPYGPSAARVSSSVADTEFGRHVGRAVQENPRLFASTADLRAAQAGADGQAGAFMPRFSFGVTLGRSLSGGGGGTVLSPLLQVLQMVYDGGAAASRQIAAQARVFESRGARLEVASALTLEAVDVWHGLRAARDLQALSQNNVAVHRTFLDQVQERAEAGAGTQVDVLTARARLATATSRAVESRAQRDRAEAAFRSIFGHSAPAQLSAPPAAPALPDTDEALLVAASPRIRAVDASIAAAQADLAAAQAARFPQLSVRGRGTRAAGGGSDVDAELQLDYDPGAPGQRAAAIRASEARLAGLIAERDSLERDIRRALEDLGADRRAGRARLDAAREAVSANEAMVEAADELFSIGRSNLSGLLDAQRDLFETGERLIAAERDLALTGYAALALTGDILHAFAIALILPEAEVPGTATGTPAQTGAGTEAATPAAFETPAATAAGRDA